MRGETRIIHNIRPTWRAYRRNGGIIYINWAQRRVWQENEFNQMNAIQYRNIGTITRIDNLYPFTSECAFREWVYQFCDGGGCAIFV